MDITKRQLSGKTRTEHDLLGNKEVPVEYYFGVQTMRALENFNISRVRLHFFPELIKALAMVKEAAACANRDLGLTAMWHRRSSKRAKRCVKANSTSISLWTWCRAEPAPRPT